MHFSNEFREVLFSAALPKVVDVPVGGGEEYKRSSLLRIGYSCEIIYNNIICLSAKMKHIIEAYYEREPVFCQ